MNLKIAFLLGFTLLIGENTDAQPIQLPWRVVDNGGGRSGASGGLTLQTSIGQSTTAAATASGDSLEAGYIPGLRDLLGTTSAFDYQSDNGWNMVSVPLIVGDYHKTAIYPNAVSNAFSYSSGYIVEPVLQNGAGYWVKFPSSTSIPIAGMSIDQETVAVNTGWNMIGCTSNRVPHSTITSVGTTIVSNIFGYSSVNGYIQTDTLEPGSGYWVKVSTPGKLVLNSGSVLSAATSPLVPPSVGGNPHTVTMNSTSAENRALNSLTVRDALGRERTLYFCTGEADMTRYELPPGPPPGMLDVRYTTNRSLATADQSTQKGIPILISSAAYPLSISWKNVANISATLLINGESLTVTASGELHVPNIQSSVKLVLAPAHAPDLPHEFALAQNFPNPFNPLTVIRYQLPVRAHVSVKIYNVLGEQVKTLIDEIKDPGFMSVEWNAENMPSGVYYYRLVASPQIEAGQRSPFVETKKLLLLR